MRKVIQSTLISLDGVVDDVSSCDNLRAELKLIESRTLANGVVVVSYEPIRT